MSVLAAQAAGQPKWLSRLSGIKGAPRVAALTLATLIFIAIFAPLLTPADPDFVSILNPYAGSSADHLLGTDASGRDLLSRLIAGSRTALLGPAIVIVIAVPIGTLIAVTSAWVGGWLDTFASRMIDVVLAFPGLLLAIIAAAMFGASLTVVAVALSVAYIPYTARVVRAEAVRQRNQAYVEALWLQGHSSFSICRKHLLPNIAPVIFAQTTMAFAYATIDVAAMSFLGLGVQPPTADWGSMVAIGQVGIQEGHPEESLLAGACLVVLVLSVAVLGDALTDRAERRR
jgi:peptide/nickel transport system permease protein